MLQIFQQIKMTIRIRKFRQLFSELNIIKKLDNSLESWDYERLDETSRVANEIKKQLP
jgi:mitochondrial fission protein ELM1